MFATRRQFRFGGVDADADSGFADVHTQGGSASSSTVTIVTLEQPHNRLGSYTWPSALVLAHYVWAHRPWFVGATVIELGAGTALPGMLAAAVGAAAVTLSDHAEFETVLARCRDAAAANGLGERCEVLGLSWGTFPPALLKSRPFQWILGADVMYDRASFEDLLITVILLLQKSPGAMFVTAYQKRSADRSLDYLLAKWNLVCRSVPIEAIVPENDREDGLADSISIHEITLDRNDESA